MHTNEADTIPSLFETENGIANGNVEPFCSPKCLAEASTSRNSNTFLEGTSSKSSFGYIPQCAQCGTSCWTGEAAAEDQADDDLFPRAPMTDEEIMLAWNKSASHASVINRLRDFERHVALRCLNVAEDMEGGVSEIVAGLMDILPSIDASNSLPRPTSTEDSVLVKHWDAYSQSNNTANTHQIDVDDQRQTNGQLYVTVGALEGSLDDMLSITVEVNTNPLTGIEDVPCAHVHFDGDACAVSLFKIGEKILVRPETDVTIQSLNAKFRADGPNETFYMIE